MEIDNAIQGLIGKKRISAATKNSSGDASSARAASASILGVSIMAYIVESANRPRTAQGMLHTLRKPTLL